MVSIFSAQFGSKVRPYGYYSLTVGVDFSQLPVTSPFYVPPSQAPVRVTNEMVTNGKYYKYPQDAAEIATTLSGRIIGSLDNERLSMGRPAVEY
jgi:hypothetical protein